eukprot:6191860-Amphidinium_carterae.1
MALGSVVLNSIGLSLSASDSVSVLGGSWSSLKYHSGGTDPTPGADQGSPGSGLGNALKLLPKRASAVCSPIDSAACEVLGLYLVARTLSQTHPPHTTPQTVPSPPAHPGRQRKKPPRAPPWLGNTYQ